MDLSMSVPTSATTTDHTNIDFDPETLTEAQRAGRACVICGAETGDLKKMELYAHTDGETWLVACIGRPAWLTGPCPAWCVETHRALDCPDDRNHFSPGHHVEATTMDWPNAGSTEQPRWAPRHLMADLLQHYRETEPRVVLYDDETNTTHHLTLSEARDYAFAILDLVAKGSEQEPPTVQPYDIDGHCVVKSDCTVCHIEATA